MIHPDSLIWIKPRHGSHAKQGTLGLFIVPDRKGSRRSLKSLIAMLPLRCPA